MINITKNNNRLIINTGRLKLKIKLRPSSIRIALHLLLQKINKPQTVCYTCMTGNYDTLETPYCINNNWDYICFTDNRQLLNKKRHGIWKIKPLAYNKQDNILNNRYHKFFPYEILKEYKDSIYIDSNINILTSKLHKIISQNNKPFALPKHFCNNCIYDELNKIVTDKKDTAEHMSILKEKYEAEGMPRNLGFAENNIIYRKHSDTMFPTIMKEWWNMLLTYSKRDQASLAYLFWKNGININDYTFNNCRTDTQNFCITDHKGK